jgi:diguanylate cyclase (GGDEF)-like protein/PAS domain S-box-containing protein
MSKTPLVHRVVPESVTATDLRAAEAHAQSLHPRLLAQLQQSGVGSLLDPDALLALVSHHYHQIDREIDAERRGVVRAMQLMSEEARRNGGDVDSHLILESINEAVITCGEDATIELLNPAAERAFGCALAEVVGDRIERLLPRMDPATLLRLAASSSGSEDGAHPVRARRKGGVEFPAEVAVSRVRTSDRHVYILCVRDSSERRLAEQTLRDSEARYRTLVDHAPEAIVVFDAELQRFVEVNDNAARFFRMDRDRLLQKGPADFSPPLQPDGRPSAAAAEVAIRRALAGEAQVFEWLHLDAFGVEVPCEVRLVRLPSSNRKLVRGSLTNISERKRDELITRGERALFERIAGNCALPVLLQSITNLIESVCRGQFCSVSVLDAEGAAFSDLVGPNLPEALRSVLRTTAVEIRNGSCAAAVYLGRQVLVADVANDAFWERHREVILQARLRAAWSTPIRAANGRILGSLAVYSRAPGLPAPRELELIAHVARLASIAIELWAAEEALRGSEAKYRGLYESVMEGVYQSTWSGQIRSANPALVQMLGYESAEELYALPSAAEIYWNPADRAALAQEIAARGEVRNAECIMRRRDGTQIVVLENARAVTDASGQITGFEGTFVDITERRRAQQQVFEEKERAQVTLQSIGDAVISTDATGSIDYMNPVAEALSGWSMALARGQPISAVLQLVDENTRAAAENPLLRCLREGGAIGVAEHALLMSRSGTEVAIHNSASPIRDRAGDIIGAVSVFRDVTKERRLRRALSYQASHDALTGLINRREFDNQLQDALNSTQRGVDAHVLMYVDLDQFKVVNDTCGHPAGDRLLRDVTALLQARVRTADVIARLGGDEFGVLLQNCDIEQAQRIAEAVRASIRDYRFVWNEEAMSIGASIGLVAMSAEVESVATLMSAADIACYAAKDAGRNRVQVYDSTAGSGRHREMYWVARVTRAADEGRLELYAQPIEPVPGLAREPPTAGLRLRELLVRLRDEQGQLVAPGEFIPAAERYNVMAAIDRWVVQRAIEMLRAQPQPQPQPEHEARERLLLAVNLSGTSLNDQGFMDFVLGALEDKEVARGLCFEITETAAVANLAHAAYVMRELKSRGCRFALDDFGSGLSSFRYLKALPVDFIKIDGQFVANIATDRADRSMVEAICQVGRALGIQTIAERVESREVLETLTAIGVDYAQGYFLGEPRPIAELMS